MYTECHLFSGKAIEQHASTRSSAKVHSLLEDAQAWFPELKKSDSLNNVRPSSTRHKQTDGGKAVPATLSIPATAMRMLLHCIPATAVQVHPCYCKCYCTASLLLHCIPATALHCCKCNECCTADAVVLANAGGPLAEVL